MRTTNRLPLAAILSCTLAAACAADAPSRRQARPEAAPALADAASQRMSPPLALDLSGRDRGDGTAEVVAAIRVTGRLGAPVVLGIALPAGATLAAGLPSETLPAPGVDAAVERRWIVSGTGPVTVTAQAAGVSWGVRVAATWPAPPPASPPAAPGTVAIPPTSIHGVTVDQAIPLTPKKTE